MSAKTMKQFGALLLVVFLGSIGWSQESQESDEPSEPVAEETAEADAAEEDDSDLDEQGYGEEDEDDFVPSQEVSADQSLPFPVDI